MPSIFQIQIFIVVNILSILFFFRMTSHLIGLFSVGNVGLTINQKMKFESGDQEIPIATPEVGNQNPTEEDTTVELKMSDQSVSTDNVNSSSEDEGIESGCDCSQGDSDSDNGITEEKYVIGSVCDFHKETISMLKKACRDIDNSYSNEDSNRVSCYDVNKLTGVVSESEDNYHKDTILMLKEACRYFDQTKRDSNMLYAKSIVIVVSGITLGIGLWYKATKL